ncbi:ROK family protein [Nocardioides albus]|uniref:Glucokinase n=1 Tax=Nocardioides albus TaxID=1841 RepID=A0A7W5A3W9_9ACTN|nr:ROK family protein [Nocardioides albus]MBB3089177.1 glucokinase [Nocardioides albus]GGU13753.1 sugar kinase [Nocardioides albus]
MSQAPQSRRRATDRTLALAFDVGGTSVRGAVVGVDDVVMAESRVATRTGPAVLDDIAQLAERLLAGLGPADRVEVAGVGVAFPGLVDTESGTSLKAVNLGLVDTPVAAPLAERLGLPVAVSHDTAAAAGAIWADAGSPASALVAVLGTGVAAVTYVEGRPIVGSSGQAGELGHLVVDPTGPLCSCGLRGCVEARAGARGMLETYAALGGDTAVTGVAQLVARAGQDRLAAQVWSEAITALADGFLAVGALLAPGEILLGGGVADAGSDLLDPLQARMRERAGVTAVPPVRLSALGGRAGLVGAARLALASIGPRSEEGSG